MTAAPSKPARTRLRFAVATLAAAATLALPATRAEALFHLAVIDEVMTSYGGDPGVQFVEIRMLAGSQQFVGGSVLGAFDDAGSFTGAIFTVPSAVSGGAGRPWIMATSAWESLAGFPADFVIPAGLPTTGGMVCWGKPADQTNPALYVDCLAYGTYGGPTNIHIGTPTPLDPVGHSLRRTSDTNDNLSDFVCADPADPTNNASQTFNMAATAACPITTTTTTTSTTTLPPVPLCTTAPSGGCISGTKTSHQFKNKTDDSKDTIKTKVAKGDAYAQGDLGNPASTTSYALCVYDESADVPMLVGELSIPPSSMRWLDKSPKGFIYKDKLAAEDGIKKLQLKTGAAGKAKVNLVAKGATAGWPVPFSAGAIYEQDSRVTAQLVNDTTTTCWTMSFGAADTKKNDAKQFKGIGSGP